MRTVKSEWDLIGVNNAIDGDIGRDDSNYSRYSDACHCVVSVVCSSHGYVAEDAPNLTQAADLRYSERAREDYNFIAQSRGA